MRCRLWIQRFPEYAGSYRLQWFLTVRWSRGDRLFIWEHCVGPVGWFPLERAMTEACNAVRYEVAVGRIAL